MGEVQGQITLGHSPASYLSQYLKTVRTATQPLGASLETDFKSDDLFVLGFFSLMCE